MHPAIIYPYHKKITRTKITCTGLYRSDRSSIYSHEKVSKWNHAASNNCLPGQEVKLGNLCITLFFTGARSCRRGQLHQSLLNTTRDTKSLMATIKRSLLALWSRYSHFCFRTFLNETETLRLKNTTTDICDQFVENVIKLFHFIF